MGHLHIPRGYKQSLVHEYHLQKGCGLLLFIARTKFIMLNLKLWNLPTMMKQFITMNLRMQDEYNFSMKNDVLRKVVP